jgi:RHH-type proline utilization regulon transcriptional repressor/proline dehydrogenase/delta 1-pyrroline-5-carboxylate dehydrogenase
MIVDSTALPEQAVQAIVESAFQSAGQRCSALRCLYVQEDIADSLIKMLTGEMDMMNVGMPWQFSTDVGPVIDEEARKGIADHIQTARAEGRLIHELKTPNAGTFIAPTLIRVSSISDMKREIFGPVLHLVTFGATELDKVIDAINATGYGLTFGLMTRIDDRVQHVTERVQAGNIYVNRNQIGAIVGSQPFGGEGLSGTGPKAGGPHYLARFVSHPKVAEPGDWGQMSAKDVQTALTKAGDVPAAPRTALVLPGPTGESNRLTAHARPPLLCMGPGREAAQAQARAVTALGGMALECTGTVPADALSSLTGFSGALYWGDEDSARAYAQALSQRNGPILPLITGMPDTGHVLNERHVCVDTTAAGGNAALLGGVA